jgi:amino acid transporter
MSKSAKISFWPAVLMNINVIVGAGILFAPQLMAQKAGNVSFLGWLGTGLLVLPVVWCIAQASRVFSGDGGFYTYCSKGINPTVGFIAQWAYILGYMGTAGTLAMAVRDTLVQRVGLEVVGEYPLIFNTVVIAFFTLLNLMSLNIITAIQSGATLLKLVPIFIGIACVPFYFSTNVTYPAAELMNLGMTIPGAIFAFWGFEACTSIGHMLKDGSQSVGKVMLTAFFITVALYSLFHFGLIHIMGGGNLAAQGAVAFPAFLGLSPKLVGVCSNAILAAIIFSWLSSIFGVLLANVSNLYMVAKQKLIAGDKALVSVNSAGRPTVAAAVYAVALWVLLFFINTSSVFVGLTNIGVSTALALTLVALLIAFFKKRDYTKLAATVVACASLSVVFYFSWISISPEPMQRLIYTSPLLGGIVLGLVLNKFSRKK